MGFKTAAQADPFDLQEIAQQGGALYYTVFDSLDKVVQATSGTGSITVNFNLVELATGGTSGSAARVQSPVKHTITSPTWAADRTFATQIQVIDLQALFHVGTGEVLDDDYVRRHVGFKGDGGTLFGSVADGTTESTVELQDLSANDRLRLEARWTAGTDAEFFVDGTSQGTVSSNLPTGTTDADVLFNAMVENDTASDRDIELGEVRVVQHP